MNQKPRFLNILGTRGVPASHGGFETFAHRLALFLRTKNWEVTVYCQSEDDSHIDGEEDEWEGVKRVHFRTRRKGPLGTMEFDFKCVRDVVNRPGIDLVLGYNTAIFNALERFRGRCVVMNMDGIEWKRSKWSLPARAWFFLNEFVGANICTLPIADHPEIARHVQRRTLTKPVMIPYGADKVEDAPRAPVEALGLKPGRYFISIARLEPENSILEIVRAYRRAESEMALVVLGKLDPANAYHRQVREAGGDDVVFPGAIYDPQVVQALRFHCRAYLHGHQVGGTNPSLVEALGAGNAVIAHDNKFNRWTAGKGQFFFDGEDACARNISAVARDDALVALARMQARERHAESFIWNDVLSAYETAILGA